MRIAVVVEVFVFNKVHVVVLNFKMAIDNSLFLEMLCVNNLRCQTSKLFYISNCSCSSDIWAS